MEKKWQKRNSKLNTYSALVMHSYFNFDREFVKSNFQYNPRWRPRWAPFLMTSQTKSLHFPVHLACQPVKTAVSPCSSPLGKFRRKNETPLTAENGERRLYLQTTIHLGSVQSNKPGFLSLLTISFYRQLTIVGQRRTTQTLAQFICLHMMQKSLSPGCVH